MALTFEPAAAVETVVQPDLEHLRSQYAETFAALTATPRGTREHDRLFGFIVEIERQIRACDSDPLD